MEQWLDYRTQVPFGYSRARIRSFPTGALIALPADERESLARRASQCAQDPYHPTQQETFVRAAQRAATECLSAETRGAVRRVLDREFGAALIVNLPIDPALPPTPDQGGPLAVGYKPTHVSEFLAVVLGTLIDAEIFNFRQEGAGSAPLFDNVVPIRSLRYQRGAGGYTNNFPFHCESAWHRMTPDYVALVGVRADRGAHTLVTSVVDLADVGLAEQMPPSAYRLKPPDLYLQLYDVGMPLGTPMYNTCAPLEGSPPTAIRVNFNGTECRGRPALRWLADLEDLVEERAVGTVLGPGNALLMNNSRVCHTRTGYEPEFGSTARWFLRANFKSHLWPATSAVSTGLSAAERAVMRVHGWMDANGELSGRLVEFAASPANARSLPDAHRAVLDKALHMTPLPGSRVV